MYREMKSSAMTDCPVCSPWGNVLRAALRCSWCLLLVLMPLPVMGGGRQCGRHRPDRLTVDMMESRPAAAYGVAGRVCASRPALGWQLPAGTSQTAWRVLVATEPGLLREGKADVWDSGVRESVQSVGVAFEGAPLKAGTSYWWTVKTWTRADAGSTVGRESRWASPMQFVTATVQDSCFSHYPLVKTRQKPLRDTRPAALTSVYDFGKDAFAQLTLRVRTTHDGDSITVRLGEAMREGRVDSKPQGSVRYASYVIPLRRGTHDYPLRLRPDRRNTTPGANESGVDPILMPPSIGEVFPFRYVEVEGRGQVRAVWRQAVHVPFDEQEAQFHCSDTVLNQVWELCKYSIRATSFAGIYVDGDRERIPYEADALVNQLSHYTTDREYTTARRSIAHLIEHPTWPTEWILITPRMAWLDYLYTADRRMLERYYTDLAAKTLAPLRDERGLLSRPDWHCTSVIFWSVE